MQTSVATLLLLTAAVIITCIVVNYAVTVVEQTLNTQNNPELTRLKNLESSVMNQTDQVLNETQPLLPSSGTP